MVILIIGAGNYCHWHNLSIYAKQKQLGAVKMVLPSKVESLFINMTGKNKNIYQVAA